MSDRFLLLIFFYNRQFGSFLNWSLTCEYLRNTICKTSMFGGISCKRAEEHIATEKILRFEFTQEKEEVYRRHATSM